MPRSLLLLIAAGLLALAVPGCDDDTGGTCRQLVQELCGAADPARCEQAEAWLAETMKSPEGELRRLAPDQRDIACKAILGNPEVLERYRDEVRRALLAP